MNKKDLIKSPSFKNTTDELKDLLAGDKSILERPEFKNLDLQKLQIALDFITNNPNLNEGQRRDLVENSWKINYRSKPPTPEEFLTEKYLGPTATHTYDRIKKVFCEFLDPQQPCRDLILYPHIGFGKSYLATLITLYLTTCITMMRDPYKFFGLNPATNLVQLLISYSLKKSSELLLEPYLQILAASPFFEKVHTKEGMVKAQAEFAENEEVTKIYYTTASPTSALEFSGNLKIKLASSVQGLLGLSVISAVLSELAFFIDAGKALDLDELIKTPDGPKKMGDIKIGDYVLSPSGDYTRVANIPWQGEDDLYEIEVEDGRTVRCNRNHLWPATFIDSQGIFHDEVITTGFMIDHPDVQFTLKSL